MSKRPLLLHPDLFYLRQDHIMKLFSLGSTAAYNKIKYISDVEDIPPTRITIALYCKHHDHNEEALKVSVAHNFNIEFINNN